MPEIVIFGLTSCEALDIILVAFQRQQVAKAVSPAEDGKSFDCFTVLMSFGMRTVSFLNVPTILTEVKSKNAQRKGSV